MYKNDEVVNTTRASHKKLTHFGGISLFDKEAIPCHTTASACSPLTLAC